MKQIIGILTVIFMASCKPSETDVVGKYFTKHDMAKEYLELKEGGAFVHYYKNDSHEEFNEGRWEFRLIDGQNKLELTNYIDYVLPYEDVNNSRGKVGNVSCYWFKDRIEMFPDGYDEYNFYREE